MAGKKQHHVWQMLQRGFSWREHNDSHVWVYRRDEAPKQTVTRKFGWESQFYGEEGSTADVNITDFENLMQEFVHEARKKSDGEQVDTKLAAALVAHLEMRSLFLRDEISRLGDRVFKFVRDSFSSEKKFSTIMMSYLNNHREHFQVEMDKLSIPKEMRGALTDLLMQAAPEKIKEIAGETARHFGFLYDAMAASLAKTVKSSHNKALETNFSEIVRTEGHEAMAFSVMRYMHDDFILPDTSLAFFGKRGCFPVSQKDDKIEAVILPLSSKVAIIGRSDPAFKRDLPVIQRALASCSYQAFLSPRMGGDLVKLSGRISRNARLLTEAEIGSIIRLESLMSI
jgi:hypothetical protein